MDDETGNSPDFFKVQSTFSGQASGGANRYSNERPFSSCNAVVVGLGGVGGSAAWHFAEQGHSVSVIEANSIPGLSAFERNGGIVLDGFEGDPVKMVGRYPRATVAKLLSISHQGIATVRKLAAAVGVEFKEIGYNTVFRNKWEKRNFDRRMELLGELVPHLYSGAFTELSKDQIVGGEYYEYGGVHCCYGGTVPTAAQMQATVDKLSENKNVRIAMGKAAIGLEPAPGGKSRLFYKDRKGRIDTVEADHVILTGKSGEILRDFTPIQQVATGMVTINRLPRDLAAQILSSDLGFVPHQGTQTIAPDYYRPFYDGDGNLSFAFGASGRVGNNETRFTISDVKTRLARVLPEIGRGIDKGSISFTGAWAGWQAFSPTELPQVLAYDIQKSRFVEFEELEKRNVQPDIPSVLWVGNLGGHGITFASDLGKRAAYYGPEDHEVFRLLGSLKAKKPLSRSALQKQAARERLWLDPDRRVKSKGDNNYDATGRDWEDRGHHASKWRSSKTFKQDPHHINQVAQGPRQRNSYPKYFNKHPLNIG